MEGLWTQLVTWWRVARESNLLNSFGNLVLLGAGAGFIAHGAVRCVYKWIMERGGDGMENMTIDGACEVTPVLWKFSSIAVVGLRSPSLESLGPLITDVTFSLSKSSGRSLRLTRAINPFPRVTPVWIRFSAWTATACQPWMSRCSATIGPSQKCWSRLARRRVINVSIHEFHCVSHLPLVPSASKGFYLIPVNIESRGLKQAGGTSRATKH